MHLSSTDFCILLQHPVTLTPCTHPSTTLVFCSQSPTALASYSHLQLEAARTEAEAVRRRKGEELEAVEARVRAALAKKDEAIAGLREQLTHITNQLAEEGMD